MSYDIIFFAAIAGLVLYRLWSVLGQRHGDEPERPNPFAPPPESSEVRKPTAGGAPALPLPPRLLPPPGSLAGGLAAVQEKLPSFDEKQFLRTARESFTRILGDFAQGNMKDSATLLDSAVRAHFEHAIEARDNAGQILENEIITIRSAECEAAQVVGDRALITVQFDSTQKSTLKDRFGRVLGGGEVENLTDRWVFERDVSKPDSAWILIETRA